MVVGLPQSHMNALQFIFDHEDPQFSANLFFVIILEYSLTYLLFNKYLLPNKIKSNPELKSIGLIAMLIASSFRENNFF